MDEKKKVINACVNLMGFCLNENSYGFELDIETPKGKAHCKFEFSIELEKKQ